MATYDVVDPVIYEEIDIYRHLSFNNFLLPDIGLRPAAGALCREYGHRRRIGYDRYNILPYGGHDIELRVQSRHKTRYKLGKSAKSRLHNLLDNIPRLSNPADVVEYTPELRQILGNNLQQRWWSGNGKHFRLLDLPRELRNSIYEATMADSDHMLTTRAPVSVSRTAPTSLLRACKQVALELREQLWTYACVTFLNWQSLIVVDNEPIGPIKHLCLELDWQDYEKLFGTLPGWPVQTAKADATALRLRSWHLDSLTIMLKPWAANDFTNWIHDNDDPHDFTDHTLNTIWPHVRGLSSVSLQGCWLTDHCVLFNEACRRASIQYRQWSKSAASMGRADVGLEQYDLWVATVESDEDGGVRLSEGSRDMFEKLMQSCSSYINRNVWHVVLDSSHSALATSQADPPEPLKSSNTDTRSNNIASYRTAPKRRHYQRLHSDHCLSAKNNNS